MNSKRNQFRAFGQRSIPSSFVFRSSNLTKDDAPNKGSNRDSKYSLSEFLDNKLQRNPMMPKIVKGKSKPFKSPLGSKNDDESTSCSVGTKKEEKARKCIDQQVYDLFKKSVAEKRVQLSGDGRSSNAENGTSSLSAGNGSSNVCEIGASSLKNEQHIRKRKNPIEGADKKQTTRKVSLVLGVDSKPAKNSREPFVVNKKPRPLYNHYGNGSGWWDCDMEGVDTEEVGLGEIWEGVGSTTFGGL